MESYDISLISPKICYICRKFTEDIKICKQCGNKQIEKNTCSRCSEVQGNYLSKILLGKRYCLNCIIILTESKSQDPSENKFKDLIKRQEKIIEDQNRNKYLMQNSSTVGHMQPADFNERRNPSAKNRHKNKYHIAQNAGAKHRESAHVFSSREEKKNFLKAIELSKKETGSKPEEDQDLLAALEVSRISFEEEKAKRLKIEQEEQLALSLLSDESVEHWAKNTGKNREGLGFYNERFSEPRNSVLAPLQEVEIIRQDPNDTYDLVKQLAKGSMGVIYIGQKRNTNDYFAVKTIKIISNQEREIIINEVKLTISSLHKNIIKYFQCYEFNRNFWIIEELMSCSLADIILDRPGKLPEVIISYILREVLEGIHYLHLNKMIHRDIKSDNVLLSLTGDIKIGDLGFAVQLQNKNANRSTFAGTLLWMPPEILAQTAYNYKIDIWSLGIVAYELAIGEPPHYTDGRQAIMNKILSTEAPRLPKGKWSQSFRHFIERCLVKDPSNRADTQELLSHDFIQRCKTTVDEFQSFFSSWIESR